MLSLRASDTGVVAPHDRPRGDTFPINCSTRVEFDNYKASYLRM